MKNDRTIGAMVICDSSEQAKEMARIFEKKYATRKAKSSMPNIVPSHTVSLAFKS